jgi:hypothetical protein
MKTSVSCAPNPAPLQGCATACGGPTCVRRCTSAPQQGRRGKGWARRRSDGQKAEEVGHHRRYPARRRINKEKQGMGSRRRGRGVVGSERSRRRVECASPPPAPPRHAPASGPKLPKGRQGEASCPGCRRRLPVASSSGGGLWRTAGRDLGARQQPAGGDGGATPTRARRRGDSPPP